MTIGKPSGIFAGIQKLTLLDYPDKTACTLFTVGCNFACPYCYNTSLIGKSITDDIAGSISDAISEEEIFSFLNSRRGFLDAVCISGGEPLLYCDYITGFADRLKTMGYLVKLDTNGSFPDRLAAITESGCIDYVAMDIKNIPSKYPQTSGLPDFDSKPVIDSIRYLLGDVVDYEFRTTVIRDFHTADDIVNIARLIKNARKYCLQTFRHQQAALQPGLLAYSDEEMREICKRAGEALPGTEVVLR